MERFCSRTDSRKNIIKEVSKLQEKNYAQRKVTEEEIPAGTDKRYN